MCIIRKPIVMGLCTGLVFALSRAVVSADNPTTSIVLESRYAKYVIDGDGKNISFVNKQSGKDYCAASDLPFGHAKQDSPCPGNHIIKSGCTPD